MSYKVLTCSYDYLPHQTVPNIALECWQACMLLRSLEVCQSGNPLSRQKFSGFPQSFQADSSIK